MTECQYCGKEYQNIKMHERFCNQNPINASKINNKKTVDAINESDERIKNMKKLQQIKDNEKKSQSPSDPAGDTILSSSTLMSDKLNPILPPAVDTHTPPSPKKTNWYLVLCVVFLISGIAQYYLWSLLQMHWIFLVIFYVIDALILVFLCWTIYRLRKKEEFIIFGDIEEFIEVVPRWAIDEKSPKSGLVGSILNKGKDYKQIVLFSEHFEPKSVWAEWDGFMFRIGNRAYIPPRDLRGDIFPYHVDKKQCLIDTAEATQEDAEDSFQLLAVWNQGVAVGHAAAMSNQQRKIELMFVIVCAILVAFILFGIYAYGQFDEISKKLVIVEKGIEVLKAGK